MIQSRSIINVADNSGAKKLMMIGFPGKGNKKTARLGDVVTAVVKLADPQGSIKDSEIVRALIVRTKKETRRKDGSYIRFDENAAVVIDAHGNPRGSRIFGPIAREIRERGFIKISSLAPEII
jgi:large subunit ribosomal protein L14